MVESTEKPDTFQPEIKVGLKTLKDIDGDEFQYHGQLDEDGVACGDGIGTFPNGDTHKGQFKDDKPHGVGVYTYEDGTRYEGEFKAGRMHGKITYYK